METLELMATNERNIPQQQLWTYRAIGDTIDSITILLCQITKRRNQSHFMKALSDSTIRLCEYDLIATAYGVTT
jgi:hypothetical protein